MTTMRGEDTREDNDLMLMPDDDDGLQLCLPGAESLATDLAVGRYRRKREGWSISVKPAFCLCIAGTEL